MAIASINPATGEEIKRFEETDANGIEARLQQASQTFSEWKEIPFAKRSELMTNSAKVLRSNAAKYGEIITQEMGKPIKQSLAEVEKCAWVCDFYAEQAERFLSNRTEETDADKSYVRYDPLGPVLAIMPWNFPFWQVIRFAAPALMAGNVGLLKHASNVPMSALAIEEIFLEAGFPEGAFQTLLISARTTEQVIRDSRVMAVTLTGSEIAGRKVAATAGSVLKKTVLELGGSDPFIVLSDANIEQAAKVAADARLINGGQSCIAAKRFIVEQPVLDSFAQRFKENLSKLNMGDPMDSNSDIGPMARTDLRAELHEQVTASVASGAKLVMGGEIPEGPGAYYPVTMLTGVRPGMNVADEETFGPVAPVIAAKSADEAIRIANESPLGLGGSIWTGNMELADDYARRIDSGAVFVNGMVKSDPRLPFGGIKLSGYGRELSEEGIREFVNVKSVWIKQP